MTHNRKSVWLAVVGLCCLLAPAYSGAAEDSRDLYYSVHVDTAGDIGQVNRKINDLNVLEKIVFWQKRNVKGVGTYYKVYLGWFKAFKPARRFMRKLQEAGWKKSMTVHWFKHPPWEKPTTVERPQKPTNILPPSQVPMANRFVDNGDGTVTDRKTGLMWIKNGWRIEFLAAVDWQKAVKKCAVFEAAGHTDWRLPSVEEWQSIVDASVSYPSLVDPNPFENIITHMPYWSQTDYVYLEKPPAAGKRARHSYTVMLYSGSFNHQRKTDLAFILPVRTPTP